MARVVIFGQRDFAQQAHYYLTQDSPHEVVAFCVTADQCGADTVFGLPLVALEDVVRRYPPDEFQFFVPMSGRSMNRVREHFYRAVKALGYKLISYVSSRAVVCHTDIGENCFILEHVDVQPFGRIGDNVVLWCNSAVGHHSVVGDHSIIISGAIICGRCTVGPWSYVSAHSVIDSNVTLAEGTLVGIAAVVKADTEPWGIYTGDPARRRRVRSDRFEFL
ncbi:MAG: acetyltransferase [Pseudomonadota bacterium]|jgi:sugar O-acyltransferase (sialic acid O-acetyltransferase NeuD family)|nr:acetyltransferase [Pseudomonadota bacterium]